MSLTIIEYKGIPDECVASGQTCAYRPEGPNGESQCQYCGKPETEKEADDE